MTREKLIKKYVEKIADCDAALKVAHDKKQAIRDSIATKFNDVAYEELYFEDKIISTQRRCYTQFVSDLKYESD